LLKLTIDDQWLFLDILLTLTAVF